MKPHVASSAGVGRNEMTQALTACSQLAQILCSLLGLILRSSLRTFLAKERFLIVYQGTYQKAILNEYLAFTSIFSRIYNNGEYRITRHFRPLLMTVVTFIFSGES